MTIAEKAQQQGDIICDIDGFYVWWPNRTGGAFNAAMLRELADALDSRNKEWAAVVEADLAQASEGPEIEIEDYEDFIDTEP